MKYHIDAAKQGILYDAFHKSVKAKTADVFKFEWDRLMKKAQRHSPDFSQYLHEQWYKCRDMWSTVGRVKFFSAGNTTNNRIEATWHQMKTLLNVTTALDKCLFGVIDYDSFRVQELRKCILKYSTCSVYDESCDPLHELSCRALSFSSKKMKLQWKKYRSVVESKDNVSCTDSIPGRVVWVLGANNHVIDCEDWSCDCYFYMSTRMPCSHMMHVAHTHQKRDVLPVEMLKVRWHAEQLSSLLPALESAWEESQALIKLSLPVVLPVAATAKSKCGTTITPGGTVRRVVYKKLSKGSRCPSDMVEVRTDAEKFNIVQSVLEEVVPTLVNSSSALFFRKMVVLSDGVAAIIARLKDMDVEGGENEVGDEQQQEDPEAHECVSPPRPRAILREEDCDDDVQEPPQDVEDVTHVQQRQGGTPEHGTPPRTYATPPRQRGTPEHATPPQVQQREDGTPHQGTPPRTSPPRHRGTSRGTPEHATSPRPHGTEEHVVRQEHVTPPGPSARQRIQAIVDIFMAYESSGDEEYEEYGVQLGAVLASYFSALDIVSESLFQREKASVVELVEKMIQEHVLLECEVEYEQTPSDYDKTQGEDDTQGEMRYLTFNKKYVGKEEGVVEWLVKNCMENECMEDESVESVDVSMDDQDVNMEDAGVEGVDVDMDDEGEPPTSPSPGCQPSPPSRRVSVTSPPASLLQSPIPFRALVINDNDNDNNDNDISQDLTPRRPLHPVRSIRLSLSALSEDEEQKEDDDEEQKEDDGDTLSNFDSRVPLPPLLINPSQVSQEMFTPSPRELWPKIPDNVTLVYSGPETSSLEWTPANIWKTRKPKVDWDTYHRCECTRKCGESCSNRVASQECYGAATMRDVKKSNCGIGPGCGNRALQEPNFPHLEVFKSGSKGVGVRCRNDIPVHVTVCEYVGEIITGQEATRREKAAPQRASYLMVLQGPLYIDPYDRGDHSRWINHSCNPNCELQLLQVHGLPRVALVTKRYLEAGTELTFDYNDINMGYEWVCLCGSSKCRFKTLRVRPENRGKERSIRAMTRARIADGVVDGGDGQLRVGDVEGGGGQLRVDGDRGGGGEDIAADVDGGQQLDVSPPRNLKIVKLPAPVTAASKNALRRAANSGAKAKKKTRYASMELVENWTMWTDVKRVVEWLMNSEDRELIGLVFKKYPRILDESRTWKPIIEPDKDKSARHLLGAVLPEQLVNSAMSGLRQYKRDHLHSSTAAAPRVKIRDRLPRFHRYFTGNSLLNTFAYQLTRVCLIRDVIQLMHCFYVARDVHEERQSDIQWLLTTDWRALDGVCPLPHFAPSHTDHVGLAEELKDALHSLPINSEVTWNGTRGAVWTVPVDEVYGHVARTQTMNATCINAIIYQLCAGHGMAYMIPSSTSMNMPLSVELPVDALFDYVVAPVVCGNNQWSLLVANVHSSVVYKYDPKGCMNADMVLTALTTNLIWRAIDTWRSKRFPDLPNASWPAWTPEIELKQPRVKNNADSGVFAILMCMELLQNEESFRSYKKIQDQWVKVLRLRILWFLLCNSGVSMFDTISDYDRDRVHDTTRLLQKDLNLYSV